MLSIEDRTLLAFLTWWRAFLDIFRLPSYPPSLEDDGYCLLESTLDTVPIATLSTLPPGYVLLSKTHVQRGGSNPFYWRSSTFFNTTTHPTYLVVHYEQPGPAISVSVGSHERWRLSLPVHVEAQQNTVILMNSKLLKSHIDTYPQTQTRFIAVHQHDMYLFDAYQTAHSESLYYPPLAYTTLYVQILSYLFAVPVQAVATLVWTASQFVKEKLN